MAHSFHPHPVIGVVKIALYVALLAVLLFFLREMLGGLFVQILLIVFGFGIISTVFAFLMAKFQTVTLEENSITYTSGIFSMRRTVVPYSKITEASYIQGLIQRLFGVGTLSIDSAGGATIAIRMENVRYADLKKIIDEVNAKTGKESGV